MTLNCTYILEKYIFKKKPLYQGKNRNREYSKGNKTVPGKVATTHTEDGHKQNT